MPRRDAVLAFLAAGTSTAAIDGLFSSALTVFAYGSTVTRLWQSVASTLVGPGAMDGGLPVALLGVAMHVLVAFTWAAVFVFGVLRWAPARRVLASPGGAVKVALVYGPLHLDRDVVPGHPRADPAPAGGQRPVAGAVGRACPVRRPPHRLGDAPAGDSSRLRAPRGAARSLRFAPELDRRPSLRRMIGALGILLSLGLLMYLAYRGLNVLLAAPLLALLAAVIGGDTRLLATLTQIYMKSLGGFVTGYFALFTLGAILGRLMADSDRPPRSRGGSSGARRPAGGAVDGAGVAILTYGGVSVLVVIFAAYPVAAALFRERTRRSASSPRRCCSAAPRSR